MKVVTRFAPSPTGHLHIGGGRTALFCWLLARHFGGEFRLRIEDTDRERSRQEYTDSILASMRWMGLDWDGELSYQSQREDLYNHYVDQLLESGHAYWCTCSNEEVEAMREVARAKGEKPRYNGRCRELGLGPGPGRVVRLKTPMSGRVVFDDMVKGTIAVDVNELDDMVLRRSDGSPTYNMAVVVDDHDMGVTHVLRGDDHVSNTPKQILLYQALGFELPVFGHVPMILGPDRQKLSKRHGARAVIEYEKDGLLPQALDNYLVRLGWSHGDKEIFSLEELVELFDGTSLNSAASAFDQEKLQWLNGHYLRETPVTKLAALVQPFLLERESEECTPQHPENCVLSQERLELMVPLYQERVANLKELAQALTVLLPAAKPLPCEEKAAKALTEEGKAHVQALRELLATVADFGPESLEALIHGYVEGNGLKFKQVGPPLRAALTGQAGGPSLHLILNVIGREESLKRLNWAV